MKKDFKRRKVTKKDVKKFKKLYELVDWFFLFI